MYAPSMILKFVAVGSLTIYSAHGENYEFRDKVDALLIRVFAGDTCKCVKFAMQRLKFNENHYKTYKSKRLAFSVFAVIFVASKGLKLSQTCSAKLFLYGLTLMDSLIIFRLFYD